MAAVAAALDMAAECCGAADLDRGHGAPPRRGQRRAMLVTKSLPPAGAAAEHIRHFQPPAGQKPPSGGYEVRCGWRD